MRALLLALGALAACAGAEPAAHEGRAIEALYPEGPLYHEGALYYTEMGADRVSVMDNGAPRAFFTQRGCGPTAIAPYGAGFLVLCHIGARAVAVDTQGRALRAWSVDAAGAPLRDPNDGFADGRGGVYFSDPGLFSRRTEPHGRVMHLSADGVLRSVADLLWYPNGVFVDQAHNQLYVSEHMMGRVLRYDINADGSLGPAGTFVDLASIPRPNRYDTPYAETGPDGLEIGPDGDLWVAVYGEGRILRFSPNARLVGMLELPGRYSTNISFGPDGGAATTATFNNVDPPFPGEVRFYSRQALTRTPE